MINDEILTRAIELITDRILTPVIYLYADEALEFICFTDEKMDADVFCETEAALNCNLGIQAEILDIRDFDPCDRVDIARTARLVYAESELVKMLFESAMVSDDDRMQSLKAETLDRKTATGSYYTN